MTTAVFRCPGSKWSLAHRIVALLPAHRVYLEPFFGGGTVLFSKPRSRVETVNDLDGEIAGLFRVLRDPVLRGRLQEAVAFTPWAEEELRAACAPGAGPDEVERARRLIVRSWMNIGSRQVGAAHFRYAGAASHVVPASAWARLPESIRAAGLRLQGVQVLCRDAVEVIRAHASSDVLIYADPPYPLSARSKRGALYRHEIADADHEVLLAALRAHPGPVALSGYRCGLYDTRLADWRRVDLRGTSQGHAAKVEALWLSPPASRVLSMRTLW